MQPPPIFASMGTRAGLLATTGAAVFCMHARHAQGQTAPGFDCAAQGRSPAQSVDAVSGASAKGRCVIILGNLHVSAADADAISHSMGGLRKLGVDTVAVEMPQDLQPDIDKYLVSPGKVKDKQQLLLAWAARSAGFVSPCALPDDPRKASQAPLTPIAMNMIQMMDFAQNIGMKVVAVDVSMKAFRGNQVASRGSSSITDAMMVNERNALMARNIAAIPTKGHLVLIVGAGHSGHGRNGRSIDDQLKANGFRPLSIVSSEDKRYIDRSRSRRADVGTELAGADKTADSASEIVERARDVIAGRE